MSVGYWDGDNGSVELNYVTSWFFECPNAENILSELFAGLKPICEANMIQFSMDGPNTNWKVFDSLQNHREELEDSSLLNLRSCELHLVHVAFKTGLQESSWDIHKILKAMWKIFQDNPAKRETYSRINETDVFPLR